MTHSISTTWLNNMGFESTIDNHKITLDAMKDHPKFYTSIHIIYEFDKSVPKASAEKAIGLSLEKYCSVNYTLKQLAKITHEIKFIE